MQQSKIKQLNPKVIGLLCLCHLYLEGSPSIASLIMVSHESPSSTLTMKSTVLQQTY